MFDVRRQGGGLRLPTWIVELLVAGDRGVIAFECTDTITGVRPRLAWVMRFSPDDPLRRVTGCQMMLPVPRP